MKVGTLKHRSVRRDQVCQLKTMKVGTLNHRAVRRDQVSQLNMMQAGTLHLRETSKASNCQIGPRNQLNRVPVETLDL